VSTRLYDFLTGFSIALIGGVSIGWLMAQEYYRRKRRK
jgi:ABC-type nitrate/sulfonate/bicarbonate transport system permease component